MSRGNDGGKTALYVPYQAALNNDWKSLKDFYENNVGSLSIPVTAFGDNALHLAVFSKSKDPLQFLLEISEKDPMVKYVYLQTNDCWNTPLHEAAANGNLEAVEALVRHHRRLAVEDIEDPLVELLHEAVNLNGETPLFIAAAFGKTEVVKFLAATSLESHKRLIYQEEKGRTEEEYSKLKNIHRQNQRFIEVEPKPEASNEQPGAMEEETIKKEPDTSILHAAIKGYHFETALYLLNLDESLAELKDRDGWTSLHLLATMPSAFKSGYQWGALIQRVIYICLPIGDDDEKATTKISKGWLKLLGKICALVRSNILEEKRKHKLAHKLAKTLIKKDSSWVDTINRQVFPESPFDKDQSSKGDYEPIPLLLATEKGIVEIVNKILEVCPQLVEHCNDLGQNILHVAIKHRQYEIFNHVKNMEIPMTRLVRKVDENGYTILHHAADMEPGTTKRHPEGPVYQLQEEIKWYKRVKEITPAHYAKFCSKDVKETCEELFNSKHNKLLGQAQNWIRSTSQSCSAVAVLVATVVFAAAYTVPGGSNEQGYPIFLNSTLFLLFTVMDVIALACSLTSVVMFLSILASPYTYDEFLHELPRKLAIGFSLLFISLATTMIAFAATLLLIVRLEKPHWATTFIYTAAFLPVSIFALTSFPMYAAFEKTLVKLHLRLSKNWRHKVSTAQEVSFQAGFLCRPRSS
ncbi:ankyrin repeat-containing protein At5g02620-like [Mangifera indica]|uniref:ankyrin repeat-containing protein At5g02620-like n=1 Tax=Mangifera indica TaxID=29780 RepID=UPI001CFA6540|nr:ankyrin repeat-containing protein At5g02620-like [Mangifera indica]